MRKEIFKVRPARDEVRLSLCTEDIELIHPEVAVEFGLVTVKHFRTGEEATNDGSALVFSEPFSVPRFSRFYASRIKSIEDPYLTELCKRLLYLNPKPDALMLRKIAECIVLRFSLLEMRESKVTNSMVATPVLKFEDVLAVLKVIPKMYMGFVPHNEDIVMFSRAQNIPKGVKISIRADIRKGFIKSQLGTIIHTTTEHLIETQEALKVTGTRIQSTQMVTMDNKLASVRSIRKYMHWKTKRIIDEHNEVAPFKSVVQLDKYMKFKELPMEYSLSDISEELGVSRSTAIEFRKYYDTEKALDNHEPNLSRESLL
jgi:hypothetical protein